MTRMDVSLRVVIMFFVLFEVVVVRSIDVNSGFGN